MVVCFSVTQDEAPNLKINRMSLIFPSIRSDEMEYIIYHFAMKHATYVSLLCVILLFGCPLVLNFKYHLTDFIALTVLLLISLLSCIFNITLFWIRHRPRKHNLVLSSQNITNALKESCGYLIAILLFSIFFLIINPESFPILQQFMILLVSTYFISGVAALFGASIFITLVRIYWKLLIVD